MNVTSATVILNKHAADSIHLKTDAPCPFVPDYCPSQPPLMVSFDATYDTGIDYVRRTFGIEPEIVNLRR